MKRLSVAMWLFLCLAVPVSAQMYKWVDANGKVQYSDQPPPGKVKSQKLREPPPAPTPPAAAASEGKPDAKKDAAKAGPKTAAEQEQAFRKRQLDATKEQEEQGKKDAAARDKADNCARAKASVTNLQIGGRQSRINAQGEREFMDDQQIAQELARAQQIVATSCN